MTETPCDHTFDFPEDLNPMSNLFEKVCVKCGAIERPIIPPWDGILLKSPQHKAECEHTFEPVDNPSPDGPLVQKACTKCGTPWQCPHEKVMPEFDAKAAYNLDAYEVRRRWPRFEGNCPDCGERLIAYASAAHYVAGDW